MTHDQRYTLLAIVRGDMSPATIPSRELQRLQRATYDNLSGTEREVTLDILKGLTIPSLLAHTARTRLVRKISL